MTVLQEPVQAAVWHALNHYAYRDAVFLAERLYAEVHSEEALFLLATCYYRSGKALVLTGLSFSSAPMQPCVDVYFYFFFVSGLFFLEYLISTTSPHQC
uniref:Cell division cycle protein 27 homolog n=1 Tax=Salmo salar TaxID=8030 RepID=B9ENL4_SALSA|nr:Cell division cycle protein 27 homolog [Salmo salar]